ncbi:MAG: hypothetical protein WBQ72_16450 [Terriglobales bacterium]|jgi:hypothetical protein
MKSKVFALVITLALSLAAWTQENPATPNATPETKSCCHHGSAAATDAKDAAGCCDKNKCEMKDGKSCCAGMEMKDGKSCASGKGMKACMKQCKKNGGCKDGKCCGDMHEKSATKTNCCGDKCTRHSAAS